MLTWLEQNFIVNDYSSPSEIILVRRAHVLHLIGGMLMSDKLNTLVHVAYLPLIVDLEEYCIFISRDMLICLR